jgi:IS30 family transposase
MLKSKKLTKYERDQIPVLRSQSLTQDQIAATIGRLQTVVKNYLAAP